MSDFTLGDTLYFKFTTRAFATGIPTTLAGTPVVSAYEDDSLTQITAGITLTVDFDSVTGLNHLTVVATGANGFETGKHYQLVITTGTVGGVSVVGEVVKEFSLDQNAKAIWDRVLTGATHNIATSAGRRLRALQDFGLYEGGAVWIDTVGGTAGTTPFENGTVTNPVDSIADAKTIADDPTVNLKVFHVLPGSAITLAATFDSYEFVGFDYTMALGGQSVDKCMIRGSSAITGIFTGNPRFEFSTVGAITGPGADMHVCGLNGTITANAAGDWFIHHCFSRIAGPTTPIFDFGTTAAVSSNVTFGDYHNGIEYRNYNNQGTDLLSLSGCGQVIYAASSSGTVQQRGQWRVTNTGGVTINEDDVTANVSELQTDWADGGRLDLIVDAIKAITDQFVFTKANEVDANIQSINGAGVVGDGNATPWDGA